MNNAWQSRLKKLKQQPEKVTTLSLSGLKINSISDELKEELLKYVSLTEFLMNSCQLRSIQNMPSIPTLKRLEMLDNFTTINTINNIVTRFPNLEYLNLGGNQLKALSDLDKLAELKNLKNLNIINGINKPESEIRAYAFELCKSLKCLNDKDKNGQRYIEPEEIQDEEQIPEVKAAGEIEVENDDNSSDDDEGFHSCGEDDDDQFSDEDDSDEDDEDLEDFIEKKVKE